MRRVRVSMDIIRDERDAYRLGYDIAKGRKGTGWMAFDIDDFIEEMEAEGKDIDRLGMEDLEEWVEGWTETNQFQYEVYDNFDPGLDFYNKADLIMAWESGYIDYMIEALRRKGIRVR